MLVAVDEAKAAPTCTSTLTLTFCGSTHVLGPVSAPSRGASWAMSRCQGGGPWPLPRTRPSSRRLMYSPLFKFAPASAVCSSNQAFHSSSRSGVAFHLHSPTSNVKHMKWTHFSCTWLPGGSAVAPLPPSLAEAEGSHDIISWKSVPRF